MNSLHRLGKKSATYDKRDLQFAQCCTTASLPPYPKQFGHERLITANAWQMLGNSPDTVPPELKVPSNCVFVRGDHKPILRTFCRIKNMKRLTVLIVLMLALLWGTGAMTEESDRGQVYRRVNLVSDIAGGARFTDENLVNPWGLGFSPTSPFWVADNGSGVSTLYNGRGQAFPVGSPLVVTIPSPTSPTGGTPTGLVFNSTGDFVVSANGKSGPSSFLFATEDGTILGRSSAVDPTQAIIAVDNSGAGAVYKGLAIASTPNGNFLYATNFSAGVIEMYDKNFDLKTTFTDTNVDPDFAPFGIQNIGGQLYVTFALQKLPDKHDDEAGPGNGFVDVFAPDGTLLRRVASHGTLNSPWGLALAPDGFGAFSDHLLVGNFGDGRINAFDVRRDVFDSQLRDPQGNPLTINGLWALQFGTGSPNGGGRHTLFFTAGIADESHGLFGFIRAGHKEDEEDGQE